MRFPLLTKVLAMGLVIALLNLVLWRIDGLVGERRARQWQATASIEQSLAGAQTLLGPLLQRSCSEEWDVTVGEGREARRQTERRHFVLASTPDTLQVDSQLAAEARYRGLFKANGYAGSLVLQARWASLDTLVPVRQQTGSQLQCGPVMAMLALSDVRGLRKVQLQAEGQTLPVMAGTGWARFPHGLHAELPQLAPQRLSGQPGQTLSLKLSLDLLGTAQLALVPAAGETRWALQSDWPHPSFGGRFLPATREVRQSGFDASWAVSSLASSAAADLLTSGELCRLPQPGSDDGDGLSVATPSAQGRTCLDTLGVAFIDPVNPYVLTDRATKYALLFIVLTFVCVALTEVLARRRVHPVQYTLVGLALALFYLLLLSLSEHIAFASAYAVAASACVLLLGFYAAHMLGRARAGLAFGGGVALLYAALWALLQMEQTALVIGSLLLFGMLAAVMVATRGIDWYALFESLRRSTPPAGAALPEA